MTGIALLVLGTATMLAGKMLWDLWDAIAEINERIKKLEEWEKFNREHELI
jgi:hypothetical protein